ILAARLDTSLADARWQKWQAIARAWAELVTLNYAPDAPSEWPFVKDGAPLESAQQKACRKLQNKIDAAFLAWLRQRYAPLGGQRLPAPHHVHHAPHYIAYQRRQGRTDRVALLILDGMALADWPLIGPAWRARHPDWRFEQRLLLAQIPTITAVSRQALVSGLRPADFAATFDTTRTEPQHWAAFWARQGLPPDACPYVRLALDRNEPPPEVDSARTRALCLVDNKIDDMAHDATLGTKDFQASLSVWLQEYSIKVEAV
ncbi:MAG: PglZ domain-containing protein, partial [Delftia sp.]|nr:PglZ domain-containing protein [Delftia sp.]